MRIFSVLATVDKLNLYSTCSLCTGMEHYIIKDPKKATFALMCVYASDPSLHLSKKLRTVFPSRRYGSLVTPSTSATVLYKSSIY